ncbi:MAG TPA: alpha-isopropylmalate synthase regulatory domain-containing protein, partial [Dehalococcoidia bacterium]|nr:alpha-isopropylmalate synthase regulatory domain-containing protein [Dehalococcoidia bacterium]
TQEAWKLESVNVTTGTNNTPTASIKLVGPDGEIHTGAETGSGPVDAIYRTIRAITKMEDVLTEYSVQSITEGIDAQGEVTIRIEVDDLIHTGRAADQDILIASARAYMNAVNRAVTGKVGAQPANAQMPAERRK